MLAFGRGDALPATVVKRPSRFSVFLGPPGLLLPPSLSYMLNYLGVLRSD